MQSNTNSIWHQRVVKIALQAPEGLGLKEAADMELYESWDGEKNVWWSACS